MSKTSVFPAAAIARLAQAAIILCTVPAWASTLPAVDEVTETMMNAAQFDSLLLGSAFGVENTPQLQFVSSIDANQLTFSYQTAPGQTFNGLPLSLNSTGGYNSTLGEFVWTTVGQLGSEMWSASGSGAWGPPDGSTLLMASPGTQYLGADEDDDEEEQKISGSTNIHGQVYTYKGLIKVSGDPTNPQNGDTSTGQFVLYQAGAFKGLWDGTDIYNQGGWNVKVNYDPIMNEDIGNGPFKVIGIGQPALAGGGGAFAVQMQATPEPSQFFLCGGGLLMIALWLKRK